jgi:hypothetical protein
MNDIERKKREKDKVNQTARDILKPEGVYDAKFACMVF